VHRRPGIAALPALLGAAAGSVLFLMVGDQVNGGRRTRRKRRPINTNASHSWHRRNQRRPQRDSASQRPTNCLRCEIHDESV
jgi:hypothetical protein